MTKTSEKKRASALKRAYELGHRYEMTNQGCSQCTFAAVLDTLGQKYDSKTFKSTTGLCGGGGLTGAGSCGGLSGGSMAISYIYGRGRRGFKSLEANPEDNVKSIVLTKKLHDRFMEEYGSITCRDIQRNVLGKSSQMIRGREDEIEITIDNLEEAGGHERNGCPTVVGNAAKWTVGILLDEE